MGKQIRDVLLIHVGWLFGYGGGRVQFVRGLGVGCVSGFRYVAFQQGEQFFGPARPLVQVAH